MLQLCRVETAHFGQGQLRLELLPAATEIFPMLTAYAWQCCASDVVHVFQIRLPRLLLHETHQDNFKGNWCCAGTSAPRGEPLAKPFAGCCAEAEGHGQHPHGRLQSLIETVAGLGWRTKHEPTLVIPCAGPKLLERL